MASEHDHRSKRPAPEPVENNKDSLENETRQEDAGNDTLENIDRNGQSPNMYIGRSDPDGTQGVEQRESDNEDSNMPEEAEDDPENFDSKSFLSSVSDLSVKLQSDSFKHVDSDFAADDLKDMVHSVTSVMNNFKSYTIHTQKQLETVREQMKEIKDRVYKRIQAKGYDPKSVHEKKSYEERELDAKLAQLNKEVTKAAEELIRASQLSLDSETAAVEASIVAERAAEEARRIQAEYEARRKAEIESRRAEEERKEAERKRREEEEKKQEEARKQEVMRTSKLRKPDENKPRDWENWPSFTYKVELNEFNQGIGCVIRGDPSTFKENMVDVQRVNPLEVTSLLAENEELVGDVLSLRPAFGDETIQDTIYVAVPHCTSRASAMSREAVVKAEVSEGKWEELKGQEVTLDGYKDLKFVQAEVKDFSKLCVVTRYKRNFLHFTRKGGKVSSSVDPRVTFNTERNHFKKNENFVVQLQPVDSATISRVKERLPEGNHLLTSSSVVSMEWTSRSFDQPITMTLPCPPNPVKAKKAAAARAAKEAKMKNPVPPPSFAVDESRKRDRRGRNAKQKQQSYEDEEEGRPSTAVRFYMGQYGDNEDDENDSLFFLKRLPNGKWHTVDYLAIVQVKLDLLQFQLREPMQRFMVLRTRTVTDSKEAQVLAESIEKCLKERLVGVILRQRSDNPCDVVLSVVPSGKVEKTLKVLEDDGCETETNNNKQASKDVSMQILNEGDVLEIAFRGNIISQDTDKNMEFTFNSQLQPQLRFSIIEVNKYLQRGFNSFRGFVQLVKKTKLVHMPTKKEESEGDTEPRIEIKRDLVSEHMVTIPKEEEHSPVVIKAPVKIKNETHCLDEDTLRHISQSLGDEWSRVAYHLNVRRQRIQAIMRNSQRADEDEIKYNMLLTWLKKVPRSQNKVEMLLAALTNSNRFDLAEELRHTEMEFQTQRRTGSAKRRDSYDGRSVQSTNSRHRSTGEEE